MKPQDPKKDQTKTQTQQSPFAKPGTQQQQPGKQGQNPRTGDTRRDPNQKR